MPPATDTDQGVFSVVTWARASDDKEPTDTMHASSKTMMAFAALAFAFGPWSACGAPIPEDVLGFENRCIEMTTEEIPPHEDDPHDGFKRVYACNTTLDALVDADGNTIRPFSDGTMIVKSSRRPDQDFNWLVATAEKINGEWEWFEYTRNFEDETLRQIAAGESLCIDCHRQVESIDWIFSNYVAR